MKKTMLFMLFALLVLGSFSLSCVQQDVTLPMASPKVTIIQRIGLTDITITIPAPADQKKKLQAEIKKIQ